ncbi:MAG: DUF4230 domain-containing protein [Solobacterium sp.]|nr:DUF4230 domain-containing protein [Solobacterium sp.]
MTDQKNTPVISDETEELRLENERLFRNNQDIKEENRRLHEALQQAEKEKNRQTAYTAPEPVRKPVRTNSRGFSWVGSFIIGLLSGMVILQLLQQYVFKPIDNPVDHIVEDVHHEIDEVLDQTFTGFTAADFQDAVLGETKQKQEMIVMEQSVQMTTTITKAGLGQLKIFSKMKDITFHADGIYTVDLSYIDADHILVDDENKTVTIAIPHAQLHTVKPDITATEFSDTEHGLLAFGDISLTAEQQNELEQSAYGSLEEKLSEKKFIDQADEFAIMKTWEIFQPAITSVSPEYKVIIVVSDAYTDETAG